MPKVYQMSEFMRNSMYQTLPTKEFITSDSCKANINFSITRTFSVMRQLIIKL